MKGMSAAVQGPQSVLPCSSTAVDIVFRGVGWGAVGGLAVAWVILFFPIVLIAVSAFIHGDFSDGFLWFGFPMLIAGSAGAIEGLSGGIALALFRRWTEQRTARAILVAVLATTVPPVIVVSWVHQTGVLIPTSLFAVASANLAILFAPWVRWSRAERRYRQWPA